MPRKCSSVDDHVRDAVGILMWVAERRPVLYGARIENNYVRRHPLPEQSTALKSQSMGGHASHASYRLLVGEKSPLPRVEPEVPWEGSVAARVGLAFAELPVWRMAPAVAARHHRRVPDQGVHVFLDAPEGYVHGLCVFLDEEVAKRIHDGHSTRRG